MSVIRKIVSIVLFLGCVGGLLVVGFVKLNEPLSTSDPTQIITISPGASFAEVAHILFERELVSSEEFFRLLGRVQQVDRNIIPGEYELHAGLRPTQILTKIVSGQVYHHAVTIPEGYNVVQIANILHEKNLADKLALLRLNRDPAFLKSVGVNAPSLEGYLFPDTYRFARFTPPEAILGTLVKRFHEVVTPDLLERAKMMGMTLQEVVTLASVIEKETGLATERPLVSGVFHNRLRQNIPLQSDPTVIYALEYFDGNIRKADLSVDSPYNTYRVRGLPPGPIANPGLAAIKAALFPTPSKFVYFVSRNDGSHEFSVTLAEHNRAVDKYQRRTGKKQSS